MFPFILQICHKKNQITRISFFGSLIFTFMLVAAPASAVQVKGLYRANVQVSDQSRDVRHQGLIDALKKVLIKVAGSREVVTNQALMNAIQQPEQWVQQFSYQNTPPPPVASSQTGSSAKAISDQSSSGASKGAGANNSNNSQTQNPGYVLSVLFSRSAINKLLQQNLEPIWGANRPSVLIWLAIAQDNGGRQLQAAGQDPWSSWIISDADARGIPAFLPTMDLQDEANMNSSDVWGLFMDPVVAASARYGADVVVAAKVYPLATGVWKAEWALRGKGFQSSGELQNTDQSALASQIMDAVTDELASRFSIKGNAVDQSMIRLNVTGIDDLTNYLGLQKYLSSLDLVQTLIPKKVVTGEVELQLKLRGNIDQLQQYLELDNYLVPDAVPLGTPQDSFQYNYRWTKTMAQPGTPP